MAPASLRPRIFSCICSPGTPTSTRCPANARLLLHHKHSGSDRDLAIHPQPENKSAQDGVCAHQKGDASPHGEQGLGRAPGSSAPCWDFPASFTHGLTFAAFKYHLLAPPPFLFVSCKFRLTRRFDKVLLYMLINPLVSARLTYNLQSLQCLLI